MNTKIDAVRLLLDEARNYCEKEYYFWTSRYASLPKDAPADLKYDIFPRYQALRAIWGVADILMNKNFACFDECKSALIKHSRDYRLDELCKPLLCELVAVRAIEEGRGKFDKFIASLKEEDMLKIRPRAYRRRLTREESEDTRRRLCRSWGYDESEGEGWYPIGGENLRDMIFVQMRLLKNADYEALGEFLRRQRSGRMFYIGEGEKDYEIGADTPVRDFAKETPEYVVADSGLTWIIYGSHAGTLAFGGEKLVELVRRLFEGRERELNSWGNF